LLKVLPEGHSPKCVTQKKANSSKIDFTNHLFQLYLSKKYALMKKALCALALFLCMSQLGFSQDQRTYRQTLNRMMDVSGTTASYQGMIKQMMVGFKA
jgi:hypothetical protein